MKKKHWGLFSLIAAFVWVQPALVHATGEPILYEEDPIFCERKYSFMQDDQVAATCPDSRYAEILTPNAFREEVNHYNESISRVFQDHRSNLNFLTEHSTYELRKHRQCLYAVCDVLGQKCGGISRNNSSVPQQQAWCYSQAEKFYQVQKHKTKNNLMRNQARKSRALTNQKYTALSTRMKRHFHYRMGDTIRQLNRFASKVTAYIEDPQIPEEQQEQGEAGEEPAAKQEYCGSGGSGGTGSGGCSGGSCSVGGGTSTGAGGGDGGTSGGGSGGSCGAPSSEEMTEEEKAAAEEAAAQQEQVANEESRLAELEAGDAAGTLTPEEMDEMSMLRANQERRAANSSGVIQGTVTERGTYSSGVPYHDGTMVVNGNTYQYRSGGFGRGDTPVGQGTEYVVTRHDRWDSSDTRSDSRSGTGYTRDGVGFSYQVDEPGRVGSDRVSDSRYSSDREWIRIHPDGGSCGTNGCFGIQGDAATQRAFQRDLNAEIERGGGQATIRY